jgi:GTP-binding protein
VYEISAGTTQGTARLMRIVAEKLRTLPPVTVYQPEYVKPLPVAGDPRQLEIEHLGSTWVISGAWLERLVMDINFDDYESRNYFDQQLRKCGLFAQLEEQGIQDGDVVSIYDFEFEYQR